jgi:heme exporter protein D
MAESLEQLRAMSIKDLIHNHDELAKHTVVGTKHYLDEIHRRDTEKATGTMVVLTWSIAAMTLIMMAATIVNILIFLGK